MDKRELIRLEKTLKQALQPERLVRLGFETGFVERMRTATPDAVASATVTAMATRNVKSIADLHRYFVEHTGRDIKYKPLHDQLSKPGFADFMSTMLEVLLGELAGRVLRTLPGSVLEQFDDIILQDGTSHAIHPGLADLFPGRFKKNSPAAIELHATMSLMDDQVLTVGFAPDVQGERDFLPNPAELVGKLLLADRGYQDIEYCKLLTDVGAFFIVRATTSIDPTVVTARSGGRSRHHLSGLRLKEVRRKLNRKDGDLTVRWKRKGKVIEHRLVLLWNPKTNKHTMLLTNLSRIQAAPEQVGTLYRLRWQVELMFKEWRSFANLHRFNTCRPAILEGLLWASLAAALLKRFVTYAAGQVYGIADMSTMRAATTGLELLAKLLGRLFQGFSARAAFDRLLRHLAVYAQRAHPKRDKRRGRAQLGLHAALCGGGAQHGGA